MQKNLPPGMTEALRLTLAGRPGAATAAIQRALGVLPRAALPHDPPAADTAVESTYRVSGPSPAPATTLAEIHPRGQLVAGSYTGPAGTRGYKLYVPSGYAGQAVPLVVMLHGCTQSAEDSAAGTRLNERAEQEPCLIVYPEQTASANQSRCWRWFQAAHQVRDAGEPSLIAGITGQVMAAYRVDPYRVYIAGMSAGGAMAAIVAAAYPDVFAAVGVHSGLARGAAHDLPSAFAAMRRGGPAAAEGGGLGAEAGLPLIVFHGDRDATVHPRNGQRVLAGAVRLADAGQRVTVSQGQVPGGRAYTRTRYHDAEAGVVAEHWLVHGSGHAWSGGSLAGSFTDPRGPDATAEMLRFFREHPKGSAGYRSPQP